MRSTRSVAAVVLSLLARGRRARGRARCRLGRPRRLVRRRSADPEPVAVAARLPALGPQLRAPRRRRDGPLARRRLLQRCEDDEHGGVAEHQRGHQPAAVQRAVGGDEGRLGADRRQRHRLHRDPPELRHLQPVRQARARTATGPAPTTRSTARIAAAAPKVAAVLAGIKSRAPSARILRRQLRRDPARDRQRLLAAGPVRLLRRAVPARQAEGPQRDAADAGRGGRRGLRRRLHARASAATPASRPARAGSSRSCPATPPRRSIPTPAGWRASRRWSRRRRAKPHRERRSAAPV